MIEEIPVLVERARLGLIDRIRRSLDDAHIETLVKVSATYANRILILGLGLIISILVARSLGPEGRGFYAVAVTIHAIGVQLGNLGLHASNTYTVARDRSTLSALAGNSLAVSVLLGGIWAVVGGLYFVWRPVQAPLEGPLLWIALASIPIGLFFLFFQNLLLGIQEVRTYNAVDLASKALVVLAILVLILVQRVTVENVLLCTFAGLAVGGGWGLIRIMHRSGEPLTFSRDIFFKELRYGIKAYLTALFGFLVLRVDLLMVKAFLGAEQTGYYSIAVSLTDLLYSLPVAAGLILFPQLSGMVQMKEKWACAWKNVKLLAFAMGGMILLSLPLAGPAVRLLFGEAFMPAVPAFLWLLPGIFFLGMETVAVQYLNSIGFPREIVGIWAGALLLNLGLNLWFIPRFGLTGASIVSSISYGIVFLAVVFLIYRNRPEKSHEPG